MTDNRRALGAVLRPVAAGLVAFRSERRAVGLRAGQNVVHVGIVAEAVDDFALLVERGLLGQVVLAVQLGDVLGNDHALGVLPWALADAVARIDGHRATSRLRREIGVPGLSAGACRLRQRLAIFVGAVEPAEIRAFAGSGAGDEERHVGLLREGAAADEGDGGSCGESACDGHDSSGVCWLGKTFGMEEYSRTVLVESRTRNGRACPGYSRGAAAERSAKRCVPVGTLPRCMPAWMPGTRPGMTRVIKVA